MKRIPMGYEARRRAALQRRRRVRAGKVAVVALATITTLLWGYAYLAG